jgi:hypothetical protein
VKIPALPDRSRQKRLYPWLKSLFNIFWQVPFSAKFPFFSVKIPCKAQALLRNFA